MRKTINILSVDWDYFMSSTNFKREKLYIPDSGEDWTEEERDIMWSSQYALYPSLYNEGIDENRFNKFKEYIKNHKFQRFTITDSHKELYDLIDNLSNMFYFNLVNLDFHHDIFDNMNPEIDCGNWLRRLLIKQNDPHNKVLWINHKTSDRKIWKQFNCVKLVQSTNFNRILKYDFQILFVCKSEIFSPPHLDKYFQILFNDYQDDVNSYVYRNRFEKIENMIPQRNIEIKKSLSYIKRDIKKNWIQYRLGGWYNQNIKGE